jgi:hypothetical protein
MKSDAIVPFVVLMLLLQAAATAFLWILNVLSVETTDTFAVLLAANLIAFATIVQLYRNPGRPEPESNSDDVPAAPATTGAAPSTAQVPSAVHPPTQVASSEPSMPESPGFAALPRIIHIGIPIASALVILAFAIVTFLPPNKTTLPIESTTFFIPIYLMIVVVMVFGSMYLFKRLMDAEEAPPAR